jgi:hypothetical protein
MRTGTHFRFMFPGLQDGWDAIADYEAGVLILDTPNGQVEFDVHHIRHCLDKPYHVEQPQGGWKKEFTDAEKAKLRPMAETLAMMDSNAFFTMSSGGKEHYEYYLPEAHAIYEGNGGDNGWAGESSIRKNAPQQESGNT